MKTTKNNPHQLLLSRGFRYLSARSRSEKEIREYLHSKALLLGIASDVVDTVIGRLKEMDYINDQKFTDTLIAQSVLGKPKGLSAIRYALKKKGISEMDINDALTKNTELNDSEIQYELAKKALGKKAIIYSHTPFPECSRKLQGYLFRRGFSSQIIQRLVDDYCKKAYNKL